MKKLVAISIILTIFCLFLTNRFWINQNFFNFYIFISIGILSFLFFFKTSYYLINLKITSNKPLTEILFLTLFFTLLFIPMSHIDNAEISEQENRTLAKFKPLFTEQGRINYDFGKNFNEWFNDRFNFRDKLLALNSKINLSTNKNIEIKSEGFIDKNTGFMYYNRNFYRYSKKEIQTNIKSLLKLNDFCKQNNIKLYVLVTPPKDEIYAPTDSIVVHKSNKPFEDYIQKLQNLVFIYPINEFKETAQNHYVFFKTDDHWTDDGAFVGYKSLIKNIKKDFPLIKELSQNDFNYSYNNLIRCDWERKYTYGRTATKLGIFNHDKYHATPYRYYTHKDFNNLKIKVKNEPLHREKDYFYPKGANYRVILLGTSQNENLTEFIPFTFKNVKRIRTNNVQGISSTESTKIMKYWQKDIVEYKPDILIFCMTYDNLSKLHYLFKN